MDTKGTEKGSQPSGSTTVVTPLPAEELSMAASPTALWAVGCGRCALLIAGPPVSLVTSDIN